MRTKMTIKTIVISCLSLCATITIKADHPSCELDLNGFAPLATKVYVRKGEQLEKTRPLDVYRHLARLKEVLGQHDIPIIKFDKKINLAQAIPRTNLKLAYDLLLTSNIIYNQQHQVISLVPQLSYPEEIKPKHVYQWVDAAVAYWQCISPNAKLERDIHTSYEITPLDVFYQMAEIQNTLARKLNKEKQTEFLSINILQLEFLLQDMLVARGMRPPQLSDVQANNDTNESILYLLQSAVQSVAKINGIKYLESFISVKDITEVERYGYYKILSSLLTTELYYLNQKTTLVPLPSQVPDVAKLMPKHEQVARLKHVLEMIQVLHSTEMAGRTNE
jgi:hypothetical protein